MTCAAGDIYTPRQLLALGTFCQKLDIAASKGLSPQGRVLLALCLGKVAGFMSTLCRWREVRTCVANTFTRQALAIVWDFGEMNPFAGSAGDWNETLRYLLMFLETVGSASGTFDIATAEHADATSHPLPDDSADLLMTDPPYYDSVAYAELSDYFYVWLKRAIPIELEAGFSALLTPKEQQAVGYPPGSKPERERYEALMWRALSEGRRVVTPSGIAVVVFAHKSTTGWETMLQALIAAGWTVTASWPIDTEREGRPNAYETASLASSVHLVCRPRESPGGSGRSDDVGSWRDVLNELPRRISDWMHRLAAEGYRWR